LYLADALNLMFCVRRIQKRRAHQVVIFDRYIYDELANLPLNRKLVRRFVNAVLRFVPQPDFAYILDAKPEAARARKPEYPLEFLRLNRQSYLTLATLRKGLDVLDNSSIEKTQERIRGDLESIISPYTPAAMPR